MAELKITSAPKPLVVDEGEKAEFTVTAEGDTPLTYSWTKDDKASDATSATYTIESSSREDNGAQIRVTVTDTNKKSVKSDPVTLTVKAKADVTLWVQSFAKKAGRTVTIAAAVLVLALIAALATVLWGDTETRDELAAAIAVMLLAIGVAIAGAGVYLALLEFRGKARTIKELEDLLKAEPKPGADITVASLSDLIKAAPEALKAFGQLRAVAALLAVAATVFICGTVIGARLAAEEQPATTSTDTTPATDTPPAGDEPSEPAPGTEGPTTTTR